MTASTRRAILLAGSLVAVLLVLALALPAVGRIVQGTDQTRHALPTRLSQLTLDGEVGDVTVRAAGPGETPSAQATVRSGLTTPHTEVLVDGDSAAISDTCHDSWWSNCSVSWSLVVPHDSAVDVTSAVGDVTVIEITGPLSISSDVGTVAATGIGSETVTARSSVGDVSLDLVDPPREVRVTSSTGDVEISVPDDGTVYRVETDTSIGSVTNRVGSEPGASHLLDVHTSVGDITLRRTG
ncbi:DUF4097 family beta strand repeat-containing protein [Ornithinimicrobium cavernae]|uniref:DUF4097 family beta strand repeat-containing protein n=1 Tax=Ornithinimicrobium cavernae TaxID=2666047 RepID=UPI000D69210B|nr:DUF4097 family beta strand repeat-containing protein [Ornithinimicrobium cavernae]